MKSNKRVKCVYGVSIFVSILGLFSAQSFASLEVLPGSTKGDFQVSSGGSATYSIPIAVTPGTAGMQPAISLQYSSQSRQSEIAFGWSIGGLSTIYRGPKNLLEDNEVSGVKLDRTDALYIDGRKIVKLKEHADGRTEYRTYVNNYSRITVQSWNSFGPEKILVETKAGLRMEYGYTDDSIVTLDGTHSTIISWKCNRIFDSVGNYIEFSYESLTAGNSQIKSIQYTGNERAGLVPYATVDFHYEPLVGDYAPRSSFMLGHEIRENRRLVSVESKYKGELFRKYLLNVSPGDAKTEFLLTSVHESGTNHAYHPTKFIYRNQEPQAEPGWVKEQRFSSDAVFNDRVVKDTAYQVADINQDGWPDLVYSEIVDGVFIRKHFEGSQTEWKEINAYLPEIPFSGAGLTPTVKIHQIDGTNGLDLLVYNIDGYEPGIYVDDGTTWIRDSGFSSLPTELVGASAGDWDVLFFDANNDGKNDIVLVDTLGMSASVTYLQVSGSWVLSEDHSLMVNASKLDTLDTNCDGVSEILYDELDGENFAARVFEPSASKLVEISDTDRVIRKSGVQGYFIRTPDLDNDTCKDVVVSYQTAGGLNDEFYFSTPSGMVLDESLGDTLDISLYSSSGDVASIFLEIDGNGDRKDLIIKTSATSLALAQKLDAADNELKWIKIASHDLADLPIKPSTKMTDYVALNLSGDIKDELIFFQSISGGFSPKGWGVISNKWRSLDTDYKFPENIAKWDKRNLGVQFVDLDNDGLLDAITKDKTYRNTGSGWSEFKDPLTGIKTFVPPSKSVLDSGGDTGVRIVDITGDGYPEYLQSFKKEDGSIEIHVLINNSKDWVSEASAGFGTKFKSSLISDNLIFSEQKIGTQGVEIVDLNGDGRRDLIYSLRTSSSVVNHKAYINDGVQWRSDPQYLPCDGITGECVEFAFRTTETPNTVLTKYQKLVHRDTGVRFIDLNNDPLPDLLFYYKIFNEAWTSSELQIARDKWREDNPRTPLPSHIDSSVKAGDIRSDEVVKRGAFINTGKGWKKSATDYTQHFKHRLDSEPDRLKGDLIVQLVDHNSDGLVDIHFADRRPGVRESFAYTNTGGGFKEDSNWKYTSISSNLIPPGEGDFGVQFIDVNGDTKIDIVQHLQDQSGATIHKGTWINNGVTWTRADTKFDLPLPLARQERGDQGTRIIDLNGDGLPDIVRSFIDNVKTKNTEIKSAWLNDSRRTPLVSQITDGLNNSINISYETLAYIPREGERLDPVYTRSDIPSTYPVVDSVPPSYLVKSTQMFVPGYRDAQHDATRVEYKYGGFKVNMLSGSSMGFSWHEELNLVTQTYTKSIFNQSCNDSLDQRCLVVGKSFYEETGIRTLVGGVESRQKLKDRTSEWGAIPSDGLPTSSFVPKFWNVYLGGIFDAKYDVNGAKTAEKVEKHTYDFQSARPYAGNVLKSVVKLAGEHQIATENIYKNNYEKWILGRLNKTVVTRSRSNGSGEIESDIQTSCFEYQQDNGLLKTEVDACGHEKELTTTYEYNELGKRIEKIISAIDIQERKFTTNYDSEGRLVESTSNAFGHTKIYEGYDRVLGLPSVVQDLNRNRTTTVYDNFGRVVETIDEIGVKTSIVREFVDAKCRDVKQCYKTTTTTSVGQTSLPASVLWFDAASRQVTSQTIGESGKKILTHSVFDVSGNLVRESLPMFSSISHIPQASDRYTLPSQDEVFQLSCQTVYEPQGLANKLRIERENSSGTYSGHHWSHYIYDLLGRTKLLIGPDGSVWCYEYSGRQTVAYDPLGRVRSSLLNADKKPVEIVDENGGVLYFEYDVGGRLKKTTNVDGTKIEHEYNEIGQKIGTNDPDLGRWLYTFNSLGELTTQVDAKSQKIDLKYDLLGRIIKKISEEGEYTWTYDSSENGIGLLAYTKGFDGFYEEYLYDQFGRLASTNTTIPADNRYEETGKYISLSEYDEFGRSKSTTYPSGYKTTNQYDEYGLFRAVTGVSTDQPVPVTHWLALEYDSIGNIKKERLGNGVTTVNSYEAETGNLLTISDSSGVGDVQNLEFKYDLVGNIVERWNHLKGVKTENVFDSLDRLTRVIDSEQGIKYEYSYNAYGDIQNKSDYGTYLYEAKAGQPTHAVSRISTKNGQLGFEYDKNGNTIKSSKGKFTYNSDNLVTSITGTRRSFSRFKYSPTGNRYYHDYIDGRRHLKTHYLGGYERIKETGTNPLFPTSERVRYRHHIVGGSGLVGIYEEIDWLFPVRHGRDVERRTTMDKPEHTGYRTTEIRYATKDNLGSITALTDESGAITETLEYDPWGKRIVDSKERIYYTYRLGFTGHEHLDNLDLVHMNGRIYDPDMARFMSADPNVQSPTLTQNYNRYSYVLNNPYKYTDPSGFFFKKVFKSISNTFKKVVNAVAKAINSVAEWVKENWREIVTVVVAIAVTAATGGAAGPIIAGMIGGFAAGASSSLLYGGDISDALSAGFKGAAIGGITAGLASSWGGVGGFADQLTQSGYSGFAEGGIGRALGHGVSGGVSSELQGGEFLAGFGSSAFTHYASAELNVDGIEGFEGEKITRVSVDAVIGGTASVIGGGKFASGAMSASIQRLYNAEPHRELRKKEQSLMEQLESIAAELPPIPQGVVDFSAGLGDALLLGAGPTLRRWTGANGVVNMSADQYRYGGYAAMAAGGSRLAYAGVAKGYSVLASSGAAASSFRTAARNAFRLGIGRSWRPANLSRYTTDSALRAAAGRTNPYVNAYGAGVLYSGHK